MRREEGVASKNGTMRQLSLKPSMTRSPVASQMAYSTMRLDTMPKYDELITDEKESTVPVTRLGAVTLDSHSLGYVNDLTEDRPENSNTSTDSPMHDKQASAILA